LKRCGKEDLDIDFALAIDDGTTVEAGYDAQARRDFEEAVGAPC
jgi:hypothetical protein